MVENWIFFLSRSENSPRFDIWNQQRPGGSGAADKGENQSYLFLWCNRATTTHIKALPQWMSELLLRHSISDSFVWHCAAVWVIMAWVRAFPPRRTKRETLQLHKITASQQKYISLINYIILCYIDFGKRPLAFHARDYAKIQFYSTSSGRKAPVLLSAREFKEANSIRIGNSCFGRADWEKWKFLVLN